MDRTTVSAVVYAVLVVVAVASALAPIPYGEEIGVALTVVFLALEAGRAPPLQRWMGAALALLGAAGAYAGGALVEGLAEGLARAQIFLVMFFGVTWLREPAVTSPSLRALRDTVVRQPAGRRYPILWLSAHFLGSVLNLAAMSLLSTMAAEQRSHRLRRRLAMALMMGFTTASTWGPFYVSVAVILTAVPGVGWLEIAPLGLALSSLLLLTGWSYDRLFLRGRPTQGPGTAASPLAPGAFFGVVAVLAQLILLVMGLHEFAGLSIPIALGLIGPPFALAWAAAQAPPGRRWRAGAAPLAGRLFRSLPDLRNEAVAFVAASVFGIGVSKVLPPETISAWIDALGLGGDAVVVALIFGMTLGGIAGLHPVILAILVAEVMPPDVIGIPAPVLALAMLGVWGTSTMVSPFSATTLFMSRVINVPSHVIAWRWDIPLVLIVAVVVAAYVVAVRHLLYM